MVAIGCDIRDTQHNEQTLGPQITILGTNIEGTGASIPADGVIQIAFDRYLLPATTTRQAFTILDSSRQPLPDPAFKTFYDPVARLVTISGPAGPGKTWLTPEQTYRIILHVPPDKDNDQRGFRAIDRATLPAEREYVFRATSPTLVAQYDPAIDFCADVFPLIYDKCSDVICHGAGPNPAGGLVLGSVDGIRAAKNRVAQASNTGHRAYGAANPGRHFGVDMPLISDLNPGESWLMYKIELAPHPTLDTGEPPVTTCTPPAGEPPIQPAQTQAFTPITNLFRPEADPIERAILNDYVLGREMPYPSLPEAYQSANAYGITPLTFQERERIRIWITNGAPVRDCGGCQTEERATQ